ncbi:MAG: protease inhibitor I42 family protein [Nitrososphaerota archaeon]|nr:protease inhibitor I42 family protein [Nitrososphaerota archaeon]
MNPAAGRGGLPRLLLLAMLAVAVVVVSGVLLLTAPAGSPPTSSRGSASTELVFTDITTPGSPNASISAKAGEVFIIHLAANSGSTGYDWNVSTVGGVSYLNYTTTSVGSMPGAPDGRDYLFQATTPGAATITLAYGRFQPTFSATEVAVTLRVSVSIAQ